MFLFVHAFVNLHVRPGSFRVLRPLPLWVVVYCEVWLGVEGVTSFFVGTRRRDMAAHHVYR